MCIFRNSYLGSMIKEIVFHSGS